MPMLDNSRNSHQTICVEFKEFTLTPLLADQPTKKRGELQFEGEYIFNPKSNRGYFSPAKTETTTDTMLLMLSS